MDKGAHFYKCDFQVHSPRDQNWSGDCPSTEEERQLYAKEFISACRKKSLDAVAITDHHDIEFLSYIKEAAKNEQDENGNSIADDKKIIVFPGMELTLSVPCQAIIIFDADFPLGDLTELYTFFSIQQTDKKKQKQAQIDEVNISDLNQLYERLEENHKFKNRFIVLPHVTEKGHKTLIRKDFKSKYSNMPCVGGYIEKPINHLNGTGAEKILNGEDSNWGKKSLAIFPTSDSRERSFDKLGTNCTWVKWAVPTAEALRQACLAKESRIAHSDPELPSVFVENLDVSNSKFMGPINCDFNCQFNSLIGGRGTGKSTILEYLRWGLCDEPTELSSDDSPDFQKRRQSLIKKTLTKYDATVRVSFFLNNIPHAVKRNSATQEIHLKIGNGEFQLCKEADIRDILPIQAYSQKQLSNVGIRIEELKRFITGPIKKELNRYADKAEKIKSELRNAYEQRQRKIVLHGLLKKDRLELKSLKERVANLRKKMKGVSEGEQQVIASHSKYELQDQLIESINADINDIRQLILELDNALQSFSDKHGDLQFMPEKDRIVELIKRHNAIIKYIKDKITDLKGQIISEDIKLKLLHEDVRQFEEIIKKIEVAREIHQKQYDKIKEKFTSQEKLLKDIDEVEERIQELQKNTAASEREIIKIGDVETTYNTIKDRWRSIYTERADLLDAKCEELTELSANVIRVTLKRGQCIKKAKSYLLQIISGANVRGDKIDDIFEHIKDSDSPIDEWYRILEELEQLAIFKPSEEFSISTNSILARCNITNKEAQRMAEKLSPENWQELSMVELEDYPYFEYQTKKEEYIDFSDVSNGQQATALLNLLLSQDGPPLIIDQPEDDLANPEISNVAQKIWQAKKKRQLIFASHNANIVVNGDAELVDCCDYRIKDDQSGGRIKEEGSIDIKGIRNEITSVMEGGEKAFKLRKEKYGF